MPGAVVSTVISASGNVVGDPHVEPFLALRGENGGEMLRLSSFEQPSAKDSLDVAKLVSGASLNTCRCCLEVGSKEALVLTVEELGRSASAWIDSVGQLGERAKAGELILMNEYGLVGVFCINDVLCHRKATHLVYCLRWRGRALPVPRDSEGCLALVLTGLVFFRVLHPWVSVSCIFQLYRCYDFQEPCAACSFPVTQRLTEITCLSYSGESALP